MANSDAKLFEQMMDKARAEGFNAGWEACAKAHSQVPPTPPAGKVKVAGGSPKAEKINGATGRGRQAGGKRGKPEQAVLEYLKAHPEGAPLTAKPMKEAGHEVGKTSLDNVRKRLLAKGTIEKVGSKYKIT